MDDLLLERQAVEKMKAGDLSQFLVLFDANFEEIYKYVRRRVGNFSEAEKIVTLTFLDALSKIQDTPEDLSYAVWLYSLARIRVWELMSHASYSQDMKTEFLVLTDNLTEGDKEFVKRANKMFEKLSLEEREVLRLKFFEEINDAQVAYVLAYDEDKIGTKIYRVLKRAHLLLFGESDERQGVYFGELSGFLARIRDLESLEIPEAFRLSLRVDIEGRVERRDFAIDVEPVKAATVAAAVNEVVGNKPTGSNDPAKIFVQAVEDMRRDEAKEREEMREDLERKQRMVDFFDRWKLLLALIPALLLATIAVIFFLNLFDNGVKRGFPTSCEVEVVFEGEFTDTEKRGVNAGVSDKICDKFEVSRLVIMRLDDGKVSVEVDVPEWMLEYEFVHRLQDWRLHKYERTLISDGESGEV